MVEAYGFSHRDVMEMPFRTFMAYQRLASVRMTNKQLKKAFEL